MRSDSDDLFRLNAFLRICSTAVGPKYQTPYWTITSSRLPPQTSLTTRPRNTLFLDNVSTAGERRADSALVVGGNPEGIMDVSDFFERPLSTFATLIRSGLVLPMPVTQVTSRQVYCTRDPGIE